MPLAEAGEQRGVVIARLGGGSRSAPVYPSLLRLLLQLNIFNLHVSIIATLLIDDSRERQLVVLIFFILTDVSPLALVRRDLLGQGQGLLGF